MRYSESLSNIAAALTKVQAEIRNPIKNNINKGVQGTPKYANLEDTLAEYVRPVLTKHGMSVFQSIKSESDRVGVCTVLLHQSGEFIEGDYVFCPVEVPISNQGKKILTEGQATGVNITYLRRYSLNAALGINGDKDTDGSYSDTPAGYEPKIRTAPEREFPPVVNIPTYERALEMKVGDKTLKELYHEDIKAVRALYDAPDTDPEVKEGIRVIEKEISRQKAAK